jgi:hypothetical protein
MKTEERLVNWPVSVSTSYAFYEHDKCLEADKSYVQVSLLSLLPSKSGFRLRIRLSAL